MESDFSFMDFDLSVVASNGCFSVLNIALDNLQLYDFDVNSPDKYGNCLLHYAAEKGCAETTNKLLTLNAFPNVLNLKGHTPLHLACLHNHLPVVKLLLKNNAKINTRDYRGETPIFIAVRQQHKDLLEFLISEGADVTLINKINESLLHIAARVGNSGILKFLLDLNLDVNSRNDCDETPLIIGVKKGHADVVDMLLNLDEISFNNDDDLINLAVRTNNLDVCKRLVSQNIDVNYMNNEGFMPLHIAAQNNYAKLIQLLVENGAIIDKPDIDGYTALHIAASCQNNAEAIEMLLKLNARTDLLTLNGDSPLHRAAASGNKRAVILLFEHESINIPNYNDLTPLTLAIKCGGISIFNLLNNLDNNRINSTENDNQYRKKIHRRKRVTFSEIPILRKRTQKKMLNGLK